MNARIVHIGKTVTKNSEKNPYSSRRRKRMFFRRGTGGGDGKSVICGLVNLAATKTP
jgi:hypothetical protein